MVKDYFIVGTIKVDLLITLETNFLPATGVEEESADMSGRGIVQVQSISSPDTVDPPDPPEPLPDPPAPPEPLEPPDPLEPPEPLEPPPELPDPEEPTVPTSFKLQQIENSSD